MARNGFLVAALAILGAGSHAGVAAEPAVADFYNVLSPAGADPWVYRHSDKQYYSTMMEKDTIVLWRSATLTGLYAGERKEVRIPPKAGPNSKEVWAPEIHHLEGKWYVYYAASDGDNANHRMYVLENESADPFRGEFIEKGKIADPENDRWAIDGTILASGGKNYFVWSGWEGGKNERQLLYIAPMKNPWMLSGKRVEISRPTHAWESAGGPPAVNEGPQILIRNKSIHIVYSAGASWTDKYCLGMLTAPADGDLLKAESWRKHAEPVFQSAPGIFGPGHCSFTRSPDGKEDWIVYHAARWSGAGWNRNVRAQPFTWNADDSPKFGVPVSPNALIPLPGGEPKRLRYEFESAALTGTVKTKKDDTASNGLRVGSIANSGCRINLTVEVPQEGRYAIAVRFANVAADKKGASHLVWVEGNRMDPMHYPFAGAETWSNAWMSLDLKKGANRLTFGPYAPAAELDCLDIQLPLPPR